MEHYLAHIALFSNGDVAGQGDKVKLMTVHAAKGLEFPYVFLCGMNEGIFPSRKVRTLPGMEEERRLAFVALTRAEKGLYLSEADGWNFDGSPRYPSRFLLEALRKSGARVTVNADAHCTEAVRFRFDETLALLRDIGFTAVTVLEDGMFVEKPL